MTSHPHRIFKRTKIRPRSISDWSVTFGAAHKMTNIASQPHKSAFKYLGEKKKKKKKSWVGAVAKNFHSPHFTSA